MQTHGILALMALGLLFQQPAVAHPHVWIEARSDVVFDDQGMIVALNHEWTMDEAYTEAAVEGLDVNHDGVYAPEELQPLTKENIDSLKEYSYFTVMKAGTQPVAFDAVTDAGQLWSNKRLKLHFRLPLKTPVDPRKQHVFYRVYDADFFIAIEFPGKDAVTGLGAMPKSCRVELQEPVSDQQTADTRAMLATKGVDWQPPPEEDFGAMFAQPIAVICAVPAAVSVAGTTPQVQTNTLTLSDRALVKPRTSAAKGGIAIPSVWSHPAGFILATQQSFYERISAAMSGMRAGSSWAAAWTLMLLSLGYGVFHAAGPGHGKTVITGWLLATEQELRRGIIISFTSAMIQALTAIVIVSTLLLLVHAVGSSARSVASVLEAASYGMITLLGLYLVWQGMRYFWPGQKASPHARLHTAHNHSHDNAHGYHAHDHAVHHVHNESCGHHHMPSAGDLRRDWSLTKALSISFAVGIRPCTGAILALLFANAIHLYWAGVAATFVMALGTALTVSAIAILAVFSKRTALRMVGRKQAWLDWSAFLLRIAGGAVIAALGATLFVASIQGYATAG
ncbi:MAG TPA: DUF1007 family protein [Aestuariivirgaceae bacterium]|jgi:ABC-type nickel/cobalt efflux system permease component RcnA/ABC-type uncharacterized transport system substrate-binding protein